MLSDVIAFLCALMLTTGARYFLHRNGYNWRSKLILARRHCALHLAAATGSGSAGHWNSAASVRRWWAFPLPRLLRSAFCRDSSFCLHDDSTAPLPPFKFREPYNRRVDGGIGGLFSPDVWACPAAANDIVQKHTSFGAKMPKGFSGNPLGSLISHYHACNWCAIGYY